jgi:hypothetical protein
MEEGAGAGGAGGVVRQPVGVRQQVEALADRDGHVAERGAVGRQVRDLVVGERVLDLLRGRLALRVVGADDDRLVQDPPHPRLARPDPADPSLLAAGVGPSACELGLQDDAAADPVEQAAVGVGRVVAGGPWEGWRRQAGGLGGGGGCGSAQRGRQHVLGEPGRAVRELGDHAQAALGAFGGVRQGRGLGRGLGRRFGRRFGRCRRLHEHM